MTKKLWILLVVSFLVGLFALSVQPTAANVSQLDQENQAGSGNILICTGSRMMQTFKPTLNRLDSITINVADASGNLNVAIKTNTSEGWQDIATLSNQPATNGWNVFDFTDVAVTPENDYAISISGDCSTKWNYSSSNPYARGYAIWQSNTQADWDFQFQTFGMNISAPDDSPADTGDGTTDDTTGNTETLGTTTSAIAKPTNLAAAYTESSPTRGVKLNWTGSTTTDITGYKVFRSEAEKTGFVKIGQVTKATLEFLDTNIAASKTYYYQVRAYKGEEQSLSSNTASAKVPAEIGPAKPIGLKVTAYDQTSISVSWTKNTEANLTGYTITISSENKQLQTKELDKNAASYKFDNLTAANSYKITLVAKDSTGKSSPEAFIIQNTTLGSQSLFVFNRWTGALAGVAVALTAVLIYMIVSRRKKLKKAV